MQFELSDRIKRLPPYLFAAIDEEKQKLKNKGIKLIDLSVGDPDIKAPQKVVKQLYKSAQVKENQKYGSARSKEPLRTAIKQWFKKRFKVSLNQQNQILPLIGSKEGLVNLPLGFVNRGDYVLLPDPAYPGYQGAAILAGAKIHKMPLHEKNYFLPDLGKIPESILNKAKMMYLNYPNNPATALAPEKFLKEVVSICRKYGIILVYDNAYSEVYFDRKPYSILQIKGAEEVTIEFHSLSKTFCMTGFRIGWACGSPQLINGLSKVKTNIDSGIFGAVQDAGVVALQECAGFVKDLRDIISERREVMLDILSQAGFNKLYSQATFYIWARLPEGFKSSIKFAKYLLEEKHIVATPGLGFGRSGEGFIRFALTVDKNILRETGRLLKR